MVDYSIIIPAFNEEAFLPQTLLSLKTAMPLVPREGEVIVVDNNSTDQTAVIARQYGAQVVFEKYNQISRARNTGARHAHGQFLIFLDADTTLSHQLLTRALDNVSKRDCCGGGSTIRGDISLKPAFQLGLDLWNWFSVKFKYAAGSFIYCRRDGFECVGGFNEKVYAGEEIWFSRCLKRWGRSQYLSFKIIDQAPVTTSTRKIDWFSPLQLALVAGMIVCFPFVTCYPKACKAWYVRPDRSK